MICIWCIWAQNETTLSTLSKHFLTSFQNAWNWSQLLINMSTSHDDIFKVMGLKVTDIFKNCTFMAEECWLMVHINVSVIDTVWSMFCLWRMLQWCSAAYSCHVQSWWWWWYSWQCFMLLSSWHICKSHLVHLMHVETALNGWRHSDIDLWVSCLRVSCLRVSCLRVSC